MGAWIETILPRLKYMRIFVAPFMGAWIETSTWSISLAPASCSLYGSMDSNIQIGVVAVTNHVAPFMGAWIET